MRKKRCSLCGGKLIDNRCVECGLDNTQNDDRYKNRINKSICDGESMTHVHEEKKTAKVYRSKDYKTKAKVSKSENRDGKGKVSLVIVLLTFVFTMAPIVVDIIDEIKNTYVDDIFGGDNLEPEIYAYVTRELSEDGESYEIILEPGVYEVGVHIPEGNYTAVAEEGYDGYINLSDSENSIYYFINFGDYEGAVWEQGDIRLYDGAVLEVSTRMKVRMGSDNAQINQMHGIENPIKEEYLLKDKAVSGVDFEAGIYDISFVSVEDEEDDYGEFRYTLPEDQENEFPTNSFFFGEYQGDETYHNVMLPEGTIIELEELNEVKLIPSKIIGNN